MSLYELLDVTDGNQKISIYKKGDQVYIGRAADTTLLTTLLKVDYVKASGGFIKICVH